MTSAPVNADWASSSGLSQILNKPILATVATSGSYNDLNTKPTFATVATSGLYSDLLSRPTFAAVATTGAYTDLTGRPTLATVATTGAYADLTGKPTIPAAQVNSDWNAVSGAALILNKPTIPTAVAFDFGQPTARSLTVSTDYQASNTAKAAVIYPSFACTTATTVLAASACTVQVRQSSSAVTCSTGTVIYTINLSVSLGLLITQASTNPAPLFVPIGGHLIFCPTAGTFTVSAVEQSAG
jgi:hypothetical protein